MLAIYPIAGFVSAIVFLTVWPEKIHDIPSLPPGVPAKSEQDVPVRLRALLWLAFYATLVCCVILWMQLSTFSLHQIALRADGWSSLLRGGYVGMAWAGIWLWMWLVLSSPQKPRREVPGLGASTQIQILVWAVGAFSEELWRVVTITALVSAGYSPTFSVIVSSLAFAVGFLEFGLERSALAGLEGAIFAILYLWQGSFLAPFTAHLVVQAVYLWGLGQFSLAARDIRPSRRRRIRCPACGVQLNRLQIRIGEAFSCPRCRERLSVSDEYRARMRWAAIGSYIALFFCSIALFYEQMPEGLALWLVWPVALGAGTSGFFLYQLVFPPTLQLGDPNFVTLNLQGPQPPGSDDIGAP